MSKKTRLQEVRTGIHFMSGNESIAEGCLAAGCKFFGGYPITPSSEIAEHAAQRLPQVGGNFIQMEDELGSIASVLGAAWGGVKSMTATSGPGFSLMQENIGLGAMTETPCVIINVQRGGPSTGLPTLVGQADIMQARWGSHGDFPMIAIAPSSVQEGFDLAIECFNKAEEYRTPVVMLSDECVGHMAERMEIPTPDKIKIVNRKRPSVPPEEYLPYAADESLVPEMACAGDGYRTFMTGLTHDERGFPIIDAATQHENVKRINDKVRLNEPKIRNVEGLWLDDADIIVVSYGITGRSAKGAVRRAHDDGLKVGSLRLLTIWPFPEPVIRDLATRVDAFIVPEINYGQIVLEVERCSSGQSKVYPQYNMGGRVFTPHEIHSKIKEVSTN
ncbi:MAG: 2-oxoacid:acceptor oxidoreductase subunit alpha [Candidatus Hodarchaeota archaeon]